MVKDRIPAASDLKNPEFRLKRKANSGQYAKHEVFGA